MCTRDLVYVALGGAIVAILVGLAVGYALLTLVSADPEPVQVGLDNIVTRQQQLWA